MEAYKAREKSIKSQFDRVLSQIQEATERGQNLTVIDGIDGIGIVYPEVAEQLTKLGYDVANFYNSNNLHESYTVVIWQFAQEGVEGTVYNEQTTVSNVEFKEPLPVHEEGLEEWQLELQKALQEIIPPDTWASLVEDAKGLMAAIKAENKDMHPYSLGDFDD